MFIFYLINRLYYLFSCPWKKSRSEVIDDLENSVSQELLNIFKEEYAKKKHLFKHLCFCMSPWIVERFLSCFPILITILSIIRTLNWKQIIVAVILYIIILTYNRSAVGFWEPHTEVLYVRIVRNLYVSLTHECVHLTATNVKGGKLKTGFFKNRKWVPFNEAITEYIVYCIGFHVEATLIKSKYEAPYQRIYDFVKVVGAERFIHMYYSNDWETIEEWFKRYSTKYSLDEFLNAFKSYHRRRTFAYDIINKCMCDIEENLKNEEREK